MGGNLMNSGLLHVVSDDHNDNDANHLHVVNWLVRHHRCWVGQMEWTHYVEVTKNADVRTKSKKPPKDRADLNASCDDVLL